MGPCLPPIEARVGAPGTHDRGAFVHNDWYVEGSLAMLAPGTYPLVVTGNLESGAQCFDGCQLVVP